jgi:hypothetical protein
VLFVVDILLAKPKTILLVQISWLTRYNSFYILRAFAVNYPFGEAKNKPTCANKIFPHYRTKNPTRNSILKSFSSSQAPDKVKLKLSA